MEFNEPAGSNLFDDARIVGKPHSRVEGPLKVTGTAPYAYERNDVVADHLVGYPLGATIAKGKITAIRVDAAKSAPGVHVVITALDEPDLGKAKLNVAPLFGGAEIVHYHQVIAVAVADTFEQARAAANLIEVDYDEETDEDFDLASAFEQKDGSGEADTDVGDFDKAFADAEVSLDAVYHTPSHSHAQMEPQASIADWSDGKTLTVWTSTQMVNWTRKSLAQTFKLDVDKVRVDSPYIGGGFGGKLWLRADAVVAALGSRATGKPVKVALPRPLIMNNATHRSRTIQHIRLGATKDGKLTAISHEAAAHALPGGKGETPIAPTSEFYGSPNLLTRNHLIEMHLPESSDMRAPGEASGLMALEIAMDEMAEKLGLDPVEFRILNDTQVNPSDPSVPFSDRHFVECLREGVKRFDWSARNAKPGTRRDGQWLIGHGVAGAYRGNMTMKSGARATLSGGKLTIETDMTDIGTGSYTIIAQTAAEMLGLPLEDVDVKLGDSNSPVSSGSGGQFGAGSSTAGVYAACVKLRDQIAEQLGVENPDFRDGNVVAGNDVTALADIDGDVTAEDTMKFGDFQTEDYKMATFGAHFVEVGVHVGTGETRLRRMLAVCDAGRILNPKTARSQVLGGMVMGIGAALSEDLTIDTGRGFFANHDLASYEVAVHADIPDQEVHFLDTVDGVATPLKAKGVGELGICGVAAAIANAAYNATGIRVRQYPVTLERMIDQLPTI
ncbi:molybdopterin cofactor-binding domain-containing protein [Tepidamorphus sp. 3E244]|uniref:molybdopterin cofactor-binding domain-containing protein n=1 Tax=Tepidamorphus sp. 3E244 TaxID=3385498 RepID=UPI0038FBF1F5